MDNRWPYTDQVYFVIFLWYFAMWVAWRKKLWVLELGMIRVGHLILSKKKVSENLDTVWHFRLNKLNSRKSACINAHHMQTLYTQKNSCTYTPTHTHTHKLYLSYTQNYIYMNACIHTYTQVLFITHSHIREKEREKRQEGDFYNIIWVSF